MTYNVSYPADNITEKNWTFQAIPWDYLYSAQLSLPPMAAGHHILYPTHDATSWARVIQGKGGVGKTSMAAATGVKLAQLGYRTPVMSIDPAHSLADCFDLFHVQTSDALSISERLSIQELNIQKEIRRHWQEISAYFTWVLRTTGVGGVQAEELAILPGMEELSAMMYVNLYRREQRYDVIVLDAAPTAESALLQHANHFGLVHEAHLSVPAQSAKGCAAHCQPPRARRTAPDRYFANIRDLFEKLEGVDEIMENPAVASVRLVTNPEKMVLRETQRAFVYFSLHGLTIDAVIVNRVLPPEVSIQYVGQLLQPGYAQDFMRKQRHMLDEVHQLLLNAPLGFHAEIAVHVGGGGDIFVPQQRLDLFQLEPRFLAPGAHRVPESRRLARSAIRLIPQERRARCCRPSDRRRLLRCRASAAGGEFLSTPHRHAARRGAQPGEYAGAHTAVQRACRRDPARHRQLIAGDSIGTV